MNNTLRRWRNPAYRYAHRQSWPTRVQWLALTLAMLALLAVSYVFDAWRMRVEAAEVHAFNARVLQSMSDNGRTPIYYTTDPDGRSFWAGCNAVERML